MLRKKYLKHPPKFETKEMNDLVGAMIAYENTPEFRRKNAELVADLKKDWWRGTFPMYCIFAVLMGIALYCAIDTLLKAWSSF